MLALALAACGNASTITPATGGSSTNSTAAPAIPAATQPANMQPTATNGKTFSTVTQLEDLPSYRETVTLTYTGTLRGKPLKGSADQTNIVVRQVSRASNVLSYKGDKIDDFDPNLDATEIQIDNEYYAVIGGDGCSVSDAPNPILAGFRPTNIARDLKAFGPSLGEEIVNGITSTRHRINTTAADKSVYAADVWLAKAGGYIVKSIGSVTYVQPVVRGDIFPAPIPFSLESGTISWTYAVSDVNGTFTIEKPNQCANPKAIGDLPLPPSARSISSTARFTSFSSSETGESLAVFYTATLPAQGWSVNAASPSKDSIGLTATRNGVSYNLLILPKPDGSSVIITQQ